MALPHAPRPHTALFTLSSPHRIHHHRRSSIFYELSWFCPRGLPDLCATDAYCARAREADVMTSNGVVTTLRTFPSRMDKTIHLGLKQLHTHKSRFQVTFLEKRQLHSMISHHRQERDVHSLTIHHHLFAIHFLHTFVYRLIF